MKYAVERSRDVERDLTAIFDFLIESYRSFGEDGETAHERATERIREIDKSISMLGAVPYQGTLREDIRAGLRSVTKGRAVVYFRVDDERRVVRVLAVFFGGQDHQRRMLARLLGGSR